MADRRGPISLYGFLFLASFTAGGHWNERIEGGDKDNAVDTVDFIVVGGGTAGCAISSRLAAHNYSVLLLEAGGYPDPELEVPALSTFLAGDPKYARVYEVVPQENAALARNGVTTLTTGRVLGGGSAVNVMWFNRGSPEDYNNWANLLGDESWRYDNMLKYFKRSEHYAGEFPSDQHGYNGPITVSKPKFMPGLGAWLSAGKELGFDILDANGPQKTSFNPTELSWRMGKRVSSYTGYIRNSKSIPRIVTGANVKRIVFEGNRAVGVVYERNSSGGKADSVFVRARKEIILSAGGVGSPALLMRSGVGPKDVLDQVKVTPVVKYLPAGENLQNHVAVMLDWIINNKSAVLDFSRDLNPENLRLYEEIGDGPYSSQGYIAQAMLTSEKNVSKDWPDIQLALSMKDNDAVFVGQSQFGHDKNELADWETVISVFNIVGRPRSRGRLTLNTTDIDAPPIIDFQYFTDPEGHDMKVLLTALKTSLRLLTTKSWRRLGARILPRPFPACRHLKFRSDGYWTCYIKQLSDGLQHASGTCAMGSVVDSSLRVHDIDNLRVVDASVMPVITNANLQAPVYAIAEKAAEAILNYWEKRRELSNRGDNAVYYKSLSELNQS